MTPDTKTSAKKWNFIIFGLIFFFFSTEVLLTVRVTNAFSQKVLLYCDVCRPISTLNCLEKKAQFIKCIRIRFHSVWQPRVMALFVRN